MYNYYIEGLNFIDSFNNFLYLVSSNNHLIVIDVHRRITIYDVFLNFAVESGTHITEIKILNSNRIVFYINTTDFIRISSNKCVILYNLDTKEFINLENNTEFSNMVTDTLELNKRKKSDYFSIINDLSFSDFVSLIKENNTTLLLANKKLNIEARSIEEKIFVCLYMNKADDFVVYLKKYVTHLVDAGMYYRLFDYLLYLFKFNEKLSISFIVSLN